MSRTYTVTVKGQKWLNANDRSHHHARAKLVREWRENAEGAFREALIPKQDAVHIVAWVKFRDWKRRDVGNWYPTVKAIVDGAVDAGLVDDDSSNHVLGPDLRVHYERSPIPTVVVEVRVLANGGEVAP